MTAHTRSGEATTTTLLCGIGTYIRSHFLRTALSPNSSMKRGNAEIMLDWFWPCFWDLINSTHRIEDLTTRGAFRRSCGPAHSGKILLPHSKPKELKRLADGLLASKGWGSKAKWRQDYPIRTFCTSIVYEYIHGSCCQTLNSLRTRIFWITIMLAPCCSHRPPYNSMLPQDLVINVTIVTIMTKLMSFFF